jgi:crossover junction endodeoxyribonuclease RusA
MTEPEVFELKVSLINEKPPLSANQREHWTVKAGLTKRVREEVAWRARAAKIGRQDHVVVQLHYAPQDKRRRDASNLMATQKPGVDGLVDAGVVPDDTARWVTELMPVIHEPNGGAKRMWLAVQTRPGLSAEDLAAIDEDTRFERTSDASQRGETQ